MGINSSYCHVEAPLAAPPPSSSITLPGWRTCSARKARHLFWKGLNTFLLIQHYSPTASSRITHWLSLAPPKRQDLCKHMTSCGMMFCRVVATVDSSVGSLRVFRMMMRYYSDAAATDDRIERRHLWWIEAGKQAEMVLRSDEAASVQHISTHQIEWKQRLSILLQLRGAWQCND